MTDSQLPEPDDAALDDLDTGVDVVAPDAVADAAADAVDPDDPAVTQDPTDAQLRGTQG